MAKFCANCGAPLADDAHFCSGCGQPVAPAVSEEPKAKNSMICPSCGSENVVVQIEQISSKTNKHGNGIGGIVNNTARGFTAFCTLGMSNLVWKKSKGNEKTKIKNQKVAVCQSCGHSWNIKKA